MKKKFFIGLFLTIARKEHKAPAEVEEWSLPDVVHMYASYIDEAKEMEEKGDKRYTKGIKWLII